MTVRFTTGTRPPLHGWCMSDNIDTKLAVHEAVCAERYKQISDTLASGDKRMTKIEYLLYAVIAAVLFGPGVAAEFVKKLFGI
jgi:hypothetical protein